MVPTMVECENGTLLALQTTHHNSTNTAQNHGKHIISDFQRKNHGFRLFIFCQEPRLEPGHPPPRTKVQNLVFGWIE
jgi:hypothetical protein